MIGRGRKTSPFSSLGCGALATQAHQDCGGTGVGAVGMCFTGAILPISMMIEPAMESSPWRAKPSLPLDDPAAIEMSDEDGERDRTAAKNRDDLTVKAYRFEGEPVLQGRAV